MTFGEIIKFLDGGYMAARDGWNGSDMFVFKQVPSEININIVPNMTSLPSKVKEEFIRRNMNLHYCNQFAIVKKDNTIDSWVPSVSDVMATDWILK